MISSHELAAEVFDEERFTKKIMAGLSELRHGIHDGLFTAHMGEENWEIAHRVLMPAFGPLNIQNMFDGTSCVELESGMEVRQRLT